jgi:hypothetical protein
VSIRFLRLGAYVKHLTVPVSALLAFLALTSTAHAQLTGTVNVPGAYPTLEAAITDLNTVGVGAGGVTINLIAGNAQTAPVGGYAINLAANNATTANRITIRGNGNTITAPATLVAGSLTDAIFKVIGEDFVTIDGFAMNENAANTTTAAATNNMIEFGVAVWRCGGVAVWRCFTARRPMAPKT